MYTNFLVSLSDTVNGKDQMLLLLCEQWPPRGGEEHKVHSYKSETRCFNQFFFVSYDWKSASVLGG